MAMNQMKIQKMAFKQKAANTSDKLDKAVFGMGYGAATMANGGYVAGKAGYGGYHMADGGIVNHDGYPSGKSGTPGFYADGGPVVNAHMIAGDGVLGRALAAHKAQIEAATSDPAPAAPAARGPAPALRPATPENPGDVLRAEANRIAARNAAAAAPAPAPTLLQRAKSVFGMAAGGPVVGPGGPTEDKVPAMLSHGEYVMPADTVEAVGKENLDIIRHATHKPVKKARFGMANGGDVEAALKEFAKPAIGAVQSGLRKIPGFADTTDYNATPGLRKGMDEAIAEDNPYDVVATPAAILPGALKSVATAAPSIYQAGRAGASRAISAAGDALAAAPGRIRSMFGRAAPAAAGEAAAPAAAVPGVGPALPRNPNPVNANMRNGASSPEATAYRESVGAATPAAAPAVVDPAAAAAGKATITKAGGPVAATAASQFGAPGSAQSTSSQAPGASSSAPSAPNSALAGFYNDNFDVRRAVVQANRPDTDQHDLGDYGAAGSQMFGRASVAGGKMDTFSGKGSGAHVPDSGLGSGVLTPAQVEADRQLNIARAGAQQSAHDTGGYGSGPQLATDNIGSAGPNGAQQAGAVDQFGYPQSPKYQVSPEAERARAQIAELSNKLATLQPGDIGRKRLSGQIATLSAAASDLGAADERKNAFGMTKYGHDVSIMNNRRMLENQAIGYDVQKQGYKSTYDAKMAEVDNTKHKQEVEERQQRLTNALPALHSIAGGDKVLEGQITAAAQARLFPNGKGEMVPFSEIPQGPDRAKALGIFQDAIHNAKDLKDKKLPYSLMGEDTNAPATGFGFAKAVVSDPAGTYIHGTKEVNGNWRTAGTYTPETHEESNARNRNQFGTPQK